MIKNLIIGAIAFAFLMWLLTSCTVKDKGKVQGTKPVVAVSIPPQLFFVENIAGDRVSTLCLLESSADPENFEPSISQLVEMENAGAYIAIGALPFEKQLKARLKSGKRSPLITECIEEIEPLTSTHTHTTSSGRHSHESVDPHIWSSPRNAKAMALSTLNALVEVDSVNEDVYRSNYARLIQRIDSIDDSFRRVFGVEEPRPAFIVWHPSLSYFARDYNLHQISLSDAGKEASVKGLTASIDKAKESNAAVCFYQQEFDSAKARTLSNEIGAKIVEINPMNKEWEDEMQKLYDAFTLD